MRAIRQVVQKPREIQAKLEFLVLRERLSSKEAKVVDLMLAGYSDEEICDRVGIEYRDRKEARQKVKEILGKAKVKQYLTAIDELYRYLAPKALSTLYKLMTESENEAIRLQAAKEILDKIPENKKATSLPVELKVNILNINQNRKGDGNS